MTHINSSALRALRQRQHLTLAALAEKSGVSARTINRLENPPRKGPHRPHQNSVGRLARALKTTSQVLTGAEPLPKEKGPSVQVGFKSILDGDAYLAYQLVDEQYGVGQQVLVNAAPMMFSLLAELSLQWRQGKLEAIESACDEIERQGTTTYRFSPRSGLYDDTVEMERRSVEARDVLGRNAPTNLEDRNGEPIDDNPFAAFLRHLGAGLPEKDYLVLQEELGFGALEDFPQYEVGPKLLDRLTHGSRRAKLALEEQFCRLTDIPEELRVDDKSEQRMKWLEDQVPPERWTQVQAIENVELKDIY